ncbi:amino acid ABC transporter solute-binding protein [Comamonas phosphati]|nr:amino acid ABC transporter solute-binding protein [Comamonas phosphati]
MLIVFPVSVFSISLFDIMKKRTLLATVALTALLAACGKNEPASNTAAAPAPAPAPAAAAKLVVGLDDNFPPMGFRDDKNEIVGFDIDMAKEAAKRAGVEVEFKPIDWNAKEAELLGKRVDALWNGLTILEERKEKILFTDPYMVNKQIIIVKAGSPIKTKADMAGKIVGAQEGSSAVTALEKDKELSSKFKATKLFGDNIAALMDLDAGRLDTVVVDEVVGRYYVNKKPESYAVLAEDFGTEDYGVGFRKDDEATRNKINDALNAMKKDGKAAEIANKWFGADVIKH